MNHPSFKKPVALAKRNRIVQLLDQRPHTVKELSETLHCAKTTITKYLACMEVYISGYRASPPRKSGRGCMPVPEYSNGVRQDAKYRKKTKAQRDKEGYARLRSDPDRWGAYLTKVRARRITSNITPQPELAVWMGAR